MSPLANQHAPAAASAPTATSAPTPAPAPTAPAAATCPECDAAIRLDRPPLRGQVIRCSDCGVELEVTRTTPLAFELAPEVREDWGE